MKDLIVADSSPIISFARAGKLYLIQKVYKKLTIPPAVYNEITFKGKGKPGAKEVEKADWIIVREPSNQLEVEKLKNKFGAGESEAVVLAQELKAVLLVDEGIVIKEARKRGLEITSTHLILEEAKDMGFIKSVRKELEELIDSGFRTTSDLIRDSLKKVGEQENKKIIIESKYFSRLCLGVVHLSYNRPYHFYQ